MSAEEQYLTACYGTPSSLNLFDWIVTNNDGSESIIKSATCSEIVKMFEQGSITNWRKST